MQRIFTCFISVLQSGESKINIRCIHIYIYRLFEEGLLVGGCVRVLEKVPVNCAV